LNSCGIKPHLFQFLGEYIAHALKAFIATRNCGSQSFPSFRSNKPDMHSFAYTILYVPDVNEAIGFYEKAFGFSRGFIAPDGSYGELATGNTTLSFATHDLAAANLPDGYLESRPGQKPFGIEIGFATPDVAAAVEKALASGASLVAAPKTKPWGQVVAYVQDLNGFLIELCTPMS
jgi:lactoylglutathione lyase